MPFSHRACRVVCALAIAVIACGTRAQAQSAVPAPWTAQAIGNPAIAGSATYSSGRFVITAAGEDIWGSSDQFHFVYQRVSGDVDVRARIDSITVASAWSKAGVMIRATLSADSPHAFVLASAGKGAAFQRRKTAGGLTEHTSGGLLAPPQWVRLIRVGGDVYSFSSMDGSAWTFIGTDTVPLGTAVYVGLAVTSHTAFATTTAAATQVGVYATGIGLPATQTNEDVGAPAQKGSAAYSAGIYTINGGGADIWGSSDQFHYVYQRLAGDMDVKVRILSITAADQWSKAGIMIRESLDARSAHATALLSAGRGYAFQRRSTLGGSSVSTAGSAAAPPGWLRLKRSGTLITAYQSADGATWTAIGSDNIALSDTVYVGLAVTSHNASALTTLRADNFEALQTAPVNQPPVVALSAPANGVSFVASTSIAVSANASDPENQLARVEFYAGSVLVGTDTTAPYAVTWSPSTAGIYALSATAYDAAGASTRSASVTVTVTVPVAAPVSVGFQHTAQESSLVTGYILELFAIGANTTTGTPSKELALGKPVADSLGNLTVDISTFFNALPVGSTYQATVSAIANGIRLRSAPTTFVR